MYRDERQQAAACQVFCDLARLTPSHGAWTADGPSPGLRALIEDGADPLSTGERLLLYVALSAWGRTDLWPADSPVKLDAMMNLLDEAPLRAVGEFLVALSTGRSAEIDEWIHRHGGAAPSPGNNHLR